MLRRLLINEQPSFASIGYSHQQLSPVPSGTANRHSQFHCPKSNISKVWFTLGDGNNKDWGPYLNLVLFFAPYTFHLRRDSLCAASSSLAFIDARLHHTELK